MSSLPLFSVYNTVSDASLFVWMVFIYYTNVYVCALCDLPLWKGAPLKTLHLVSYITPSTNPLCCTHVLPPCNHVPPPPLAPDQQKTRCWRLLHSNEPTSQHVSMSKAPTASLRIVCRRMTQLWRAHNEAPVCCCDLFQIIFMTPQGGTMTGKWMRKTQRDVEKKKHRCRFEARMQCLHAMHVDRLRLHPRTLFQVLQRQCHTKKILCTTNAAVHFKKKEVQLSPGHAGCLYERKLHSISNRDY